MQPFRLTRIETFTTEMIGFVRIEDAEGGAGWGQVSTYQSDITCAVLHRQVAPHVLGRDFPDLDAMADHVFRTEHKFPGSYLKRAVAGIDTALWDLRGRRAGLPVVALLGGRPGRLRAYASSMRRDITPEAEAARFLRLRDAQGFDAFKFRIGAEYGRDRDEWPGRTEAIVPAIRRALGPEAHLLVDANSAFSPARAIEVGRMLEAEGVEHYEEPCLYWELDETKQVADALDIPVTGGEQDCEMPVWREMIRRRVVDVVQPDILYVGGIHRAAEVARMAAAAGMKVTPHSANLGLVTLFTMHWLKALPNAGPHLEFSIEGPDYYPWQYGLFREDPYRVEGGHVTVGDAPGWGVEPNPDWLARSAWRESRAG